MTDLAVAAPEQATAVGFAVHLDNFEGPFDLLLSLISRHKMDVTDVALSAVTDEFIAHIRSGGDRTVESDASGSGKREPWDLEQTTSFLVVASTLLDLKAARLLPQGDVEDEEDLALLEARDLLFARLLQYKVFKQIAGIIDQRMNGEAFRHARSVGLEEWFATLLPEVLIGLGLEEFAGLAAKALEPKPEPEGIGLSHIHAPAVSVREQATVVIGRLRGSGTMTFRALAADAPDMMTRVARFLALLELFREGVVSFDQMTPLGELSIRWTGNEDAEIEINDEFDGTPPEPGPAPGPALDPADDTAHTRGRNLTSEPVETPEEGE